MSAGNTPVYEIAGGHDRRHRLNPLPKISVIVRVYETNSEGIRWLRLSVFMLK